jgi:hypothetical protein
MFWACVLILLGVIAYPFVQFFRKKDRTWLDTMGLAAAVVGILIFLWSMFVAVAGKQQPIFVGLIQECFLGINVPDVEC